MGQILGRLVRWGLTAAAALLVTLVALAVVPTLFGRQTFVVANGSMGSALPVGSLAITRLVDVRAVEVGDIITFRFPRAQLPVTHRVIEVAEQDGQRVLRTKGDANPTVDPRPLRSAGGALPRTEHVIPYAGYVSSYARTPLVVGLLLAVPFLGAALRQLSPSQPPPAERRVPRRASRRARRSVAIGVDS